MPKNGLKFLRNQLEAIIISTCFVLMIYCLSFVFYPDFRDDEFYKYDLLIVFIGLCACYYETPHAYKQYGISYIFGESILSVMLLILMGIFLIFVDGGGSKFYMTGNYQLDFLVLCFGLHVLFRAIVIVFSLRSDTE